MPLLKIVRDTSIVLFFFVYFFERTWPAAGMRPPCVIYLYTSNEDVFCLRKAKLLFIMRLKAKTPLHTGVRTGCHCLIGLSVRLSVCQCMCTFVVFTDCESYEADFHKPGIYGSGRVWANAWDVFRHPQSRGGRGRRAAVGFVVCFG